MKLSFIKNTNLFSLLMFSLTSLPLSSSLCSVNNNLDRNNDNSSITSKLYSTNNGYFFLQGGHNLSILSKSNSFSDFNGLSGSAYIDGAYRHLVNRSLYINGGLGFKVDKLSTELFNGFKDSLNCGFVLFGGFKHNSGIELSFQGDIGIKGINGNKGFILNINHKFLSIEAGLSNLYATENANWQSPFATLRLNIIGIISPLFNITKEVSKILKVEFLIGYDNNSKLKLSPEISIGSTREEKNTLDSYKEIDSIYKNNIIKYVDNRSRKTNQSITESEENHNTEQEDEEKQEELPTLIKSCNSLTGKKSENEIAKQTIERVINAEIEEKNIKN